MKAKNEKQNDKTFNNSLLTGADGGTVFTAASIAALAVSLVYSFIIMAAGESGTNFSKSEVGTYLSYFLSSLGLILTAVYVTVRGKFSVKAVCKINGFELKYLWLGLLIAFGALFGLSWLNTAFIDLLGHLFNYEATTITLPSSDFLSYVLCVIFICALPAVFEELIFRGFVFASLKRLGGVFAVIAGGALFSLFHKNPAQTPYQFVMGALFCLLALKSGSLIPPMIVHFINNLYIITLYFIAPNGFKFPSWLEICLGVLALLALAFSVYYLIKKCDEPKLEREVTQKYLQIFNKNEQRKQFFIFSAAGIAICACFWILSLIPQ